ncbi:hypothetical protein GCM10009530_62720 [Microbispora corallina]|uniref:Uncharacterized protein n=1 Tax=Microbispora corallina TaxID=83302 RepID=A0ABQ4G7T6_9ACTN|nr:hypothetical protein [Microbispora corallina]GIH43087.1 hypothetical protein Mco01_60870 [Microbispora corallina]
MVTRLLVVLALIASSLGLPRATAASAGTCELLPVGPIHTRWVLLEGKDGPLGCPTGPEQDVPGHRGKRQTFEGGEVAWSPEQGEAMTVAAYLLGKSAVVEFGPTGPYHYDKFLVRWDRDGQNLGQDSARFSWSDSGSHVIYPDRNGTYTFIVEGCDQGRYEGSTCRQGWTIPVSTRLDRGGGGSQDGVPPECPIRPQGDIGAKWFDMGSRSGPLGCATGPEEDIPGHRGKRQNFERGQIVWSPEQGEHMAVAAYLLGNRVSVDWGPSTPYTYDFWQVRWDRDGVNLGQDERDARRMSPADGDLGRWTARLQGFGEYGFTVQGCDRGGFLSGATCRQKWTVPVRLRFQPASEPLCGEQPVGLIRDRWLELRGPAGFLGCPTGPEEDVPGRRGKRQTFQGGQIAWSPEQGESMVVAAYQEADGAVVEWGPTRPRFDYDRFLVRWDGDGTDPQQRTVTGSRVSGRLRVGLLPEWKPITFMVEGCDKGGLLSGSTCRQKWTIPVTVRPKPFDGDVDISAASAEDPATAMATQKTRTDAAVRSYSCLNALDLDDPSPGEGEAGRLVARLQRLRLDGPGYACEGDLPNRLLVNEFLRDVPTKPVGTETDDCPIEEKTVGDYDTFLKGLIYIAYKQRDLLDYDVWYRLLHELLTMSGPHSVSEEGKSICLFVSPESENHILLIETARYLTNQLFFDATQDAVWDNHVNGMDAYLLRFMHTIAQHDFLEFNARPYQRYSINGLLNLYDFARQRAVRTGAQIVLDYTTTKFATSSNMLRRSGPFRRLADHTDAANKSYYSGDSDPQSAFFLAYTGLSDYTGGKIPAHWRLEAMISGLSSYRPPRAAYELAMNKGTPYQQTFFHGNRPKIHPDADDADPGVEIYSSSPSFMITAGGVFLNSGYRSDRIRGFKDHGVAQPTTLMPTGADVEAADLIRFEGARRDVSSPPDRAVVNTCVSGGFACGVQGVVPQRWLRCVGPESDGQWLLLDLESCQGLGFYVAIHIDQPNGVLPPYQNGGFFYAVEHTAMPFSTFATKTKELNADLPRYLDISTPYTFQAPDGHTYRFQLHRPGGKYLSDLLEIDGTKQPDDLTSLPLADGPFLSSTGHDGLIRIRRPGCAGPLSLDFRDALQPVRTEPPAQDPSPICPPV